MEIYNEYLTLFTDYSTLIILLFLVVKIIDTLEVAKTQRRIMVGAIIFILFAFIYTVREVWFYWLGHQAFNQKMFEYGVKVIWWMSVAFTVSNLLHYFIWRGIMGKGVGESSTPKLIRDFIDAVLYVVAAMLIVRYVFNQPITGLVATSGALAVILGLSAQATLGGVFAGLSINLSNSFEKGDTVIISNRNSGINRMRGVISDMNWRNVTILTKYNNLLIMPNSLMATSAITNYSKPEPKRLLEMWILIPYKVSPASAKEMILRAISHSPNVLSNPKPKVQAANYEDTGIKYRFAVYTLKPGSDSAKDDILSAIWYEFNRYGVSVHPSSIEENSVLTMIQRDRAQSTKAERIELLKKAEIFSTLREEEISHLADTMERKVYGPPERVVINGEKGDSLFFIHKGKLDILIRQTDGSDLKVATLSDGAFFGEMALLTGESRTATVAAATESVLYEISKANIYPILEKRQEILDDMSNVLAKRQVENMTKSAEYSEEMEKNKAHEIASAADKLRALMKNFFGG